MAPAYVGLSEELTMSIESYKATARRYFEEVFDKRNLDILDEIVAIDCVIHRPEESRL
jgi:hypothetical protein